MITTRLSSPSDAALIADLSRQTFYETFASRNTPENMDLFMKGPFAKTKLMAEVASPENFFILAYNDDELVGYACMREGEKLTATNNIDTIEIARIYVLNSTIGKGAGSALMTACIHLATGMKKEWVWLGVWEKNKRAIDFYEKWGFEKFGTQIFKLGNDPQTDWLMRKKI